MSFQDDWMNMSTEERICHLADTEEEKEELIAFAQGQGFEVNENGF